MYHDTIASTSDFEVLPVTWQFDFTLVFIKKNVDMNVLMWSEALDKGFEPRQYPYAVEEVPTGDYQARLDFKIWAKIPDTINCFFTQEETGKKFQITVFKNSKTDLYAIGSGGVDFQECPDGVSYRITVFVNEKERAVLKEAVPV